MSQRRIKRNATNGSSKREGPLDWIRTDDNSIFECFYILLITRGLPRVLEILRDTLIYEAEACATQKAAVGKEIGGERGEDVTQFWLRDADFCIEVSQLIEELIASLPEKWGPLNPKIMPEKPPAIMHRDEPPKGGMYALPGRGVYISKR